MMRTVAVDEYYLSEQDEATVIWQLGAPALLPRRTAPVLAQLPRSAAAAGRPASCPPSRDRRLPLVA
jgi:hypothetical protein